MAKPAKKPAAKKSPTKPKREPADRPKGVRGAGGGGDARAGEPEHNRPPGAPWNSGRVFV